MIVIVVELVIYILALVFQVVLLIAETEITASTC